MSQTKQMDEHDIGCQCLSCLQGRVGGFDNS